MKSYRASVHVPPDSHLERQCVIPNVTLTLRAASKMEAVQSMKSEFRRLNRGIEMQSDDIRVNNITVLESPMNTTTTNTTSFFMDEDGIPMEFIDLDDVTVGHYVPTPHKDKPGRINGRIVLEYPEGFQPQRFSTTGPLLKATPGKLTFNVTEYTGPNKSQVNTPTGLTITNPDHVISIWHPTVNNCRIPIRVYYDNNEQGDPTTLVEIGHYVIKWGFAHGVRSVVTTALTDPLALHIGKLLRRLPVGDVEGALAIMLVEYLRSPEQHEFLWYHVPVLNPA